MRSDGNNRDLQALVMTHPASESGTMTGTRRAWTTPIEVALIAVLFFLYAGQFPPDVNESHYLTKARHFWDPNWCPDDLFLGSEYSHWLFYATTGWLTRWCALEAYAWIGRLLVWCLQAFAWQRLLFRATNRHGWGLGTAPLLLLLVERGNLAGEWIVGGFEAKGFAYALVLWGLGDALLGRWSRVWPVLGLASAFHLLVGFWAAIAAGFAWIFGGAATCSAAVAQRPALNPFGWRASVAPWLLAFVLATPGWLPPLLDRLHTPAGMMAWASEVQVRFRLAHHLYFPAFGSERVAAFAVMLVLWFAVRSFALSPAGLRLLDRFVSAALIICVGGIVLGAIATRGAATADIAWPLLRLYWFRLADVAVPIGICVTLAALLTQHWSVESQGSLRRICISSCLALISLAFGLSVWQRWADIRPRAERAALPTYADSPRRTNDTYANWLAACRWIRENTPADAGFLTPPQQQTFKWHAQRREVFCWKDMPQDDARIVAWWTRAGEVYFGPRDWPQGWFAYSDDELIELGRKYRAEYLLLPQRDYESRPTRLPLRYPLDPSHRSTYVVVAL